ncbi:MAG: hypothetical protein P8Z37_00430 [Acidobacteriota bacterium]
MMGIFGTVKVKNGKYRMKGDFHQVSPNMAIRNEDDAWRLMGITNPRALTHIHTYGGEAVFFENLSNGKIFGTRCDNRDCEFTGTTYLPFRIFCPDCLSKNTVVDLTKVCRETATIHTFMICERSGAFNTLEKPIKFINVEFDGVSTILMSYLSAGEPAIGKRVVPIFRTMEPTYTIIDLSWVAEGTPVTVLPEGFTY